MPQKSGIQLVFRKHLLSAVLSAEVEKSCSMVCPGVD